MKASLIETSVRHPRIIVAAILGSTLVVALATALPSLWPAHFPSLNPVKVDTDPENMLRSDEPVRVFHHEMKSQFALHDMVVVGVVNEHHPDGAFNPDSLRRVYELAAYAQTLRYDDPRQPSGKGGVVAVDVLAPSTVDNIEPGGPGEVRFEWLMPQPPTSREEALAVRDKALRIPFFQNTLVSADGRAVCLYLPLTSKDLSYRIYRDLQSKIATFDGDDRFHITGLPVAEDTFGVEMFIQMAVSAPLAMAVIFTLMLVFFRRLVLVIAPMVVAMVSVILTMGVLVITGHTIHIMSSMIPIFLMPIAVLDSIHILSEFFDRYPESHDRRTAIVKVMRTLFVPMLYTSLTTAAGFASLALTPIPPVQVFGLFVAFGVMVAWVFTITFIPASVMFIPQRRLEGCGAKPSTEERPESTLPRALRWLGGATFRRARLILALTAIACVVAIYGISRIQINDNPVRWFTRTHPIRIADRVLNDHFAGTYMAYLALEPETTDLSASDYIVGMLERLHEQVASLQNELPAVRDVFADLESEANALASHSALSAEVFLDRLESYAAVRRNAASDESYDAWDEAATFVALERQRSQTFKQPEVLRYIDDLERYLSENSGGIVGKSNSLSTIVKTVYRELTGGQPHGFCILDTSQAVAQCLLQFQSSHRPQDLDHFVTPDYRRTSLWLQLTSGDNKDMTSVTNLVERYMAEHRPPVPLRAQWFGLTYINVVWQQKMVSGMLQAFLGSFLIVFLMMTVLFRSSLWGLMSMGPLTVTIGLIYGLIGLFGKDYDMPVAVLSSLTLGLAVDFAIHFLARSRTIYAEWGSWEAAAPHVFGEPARAITRNVIVIAIGFLPLLAAPLMPYKTVGAFMACILFFSGIGTLLVLPALVRLTERFVFPKTRLCCLTCNCVTCIISGIAIIAIVAVNLHQFIEAGWTTLTWVSVATIPIILAICSAMAYREKCRLTRLQGFEEGERK